MPQTDTNITVPAAQGKAPVKPSAKKAAASQKAPAFAQAPRALQQQQARTVVTFEAAARACPTSGMAEKFARIFGLPEVDYHAIREATEEHLARAAQALADGLNEKAMEMHMQRIVDGFVRSAHGAGNFYEGKAQLARDLSSKIANEDRDEDRPGIDNTENRAERARSFAATLGLQAFALLAAAEGATHAYAHVCGADWKPYQGSQAAAQGVSRQAAAMQAAAFDRE